ncbi:MAG: preprotein translocase subunit SecB [Lentimonas sp.]|jgi:preprotein translocase subunit SecB
MAKIKINSQYVKDLSFEIPNAPEVFLNPTQKPDINIAIDIDAKKLSLNSYEVALKITSKAVDNESGEEKSIFICELSYCGIFTLDEELKDEKEIEQILLIYCPNIIFPFARKIIANCVIDGGFPPLMLEPIDFAAIYQQRAAQKKSA